MSQATLLCRHHCISHPLHISRSHEEIIESSEEKRFMAPSGLFSFSFVIFFFFGWILSDLCVHAYIISCTCAFFFFRGKCPFLGCPNDFVGRYFEWWFMCVTDTCRYSFSLNFCFLIYFFYGLKSAKLYRGLWGLVW